MKVQQTEHPAPERVAQVRLWRVGGVLLGLVLALSAASAGYAGITDINPNASNNGNANASSGELMSG